MATQNYYDPAYYSGMPNKQNPGMIGSNAFSNDMINQLMQFNPQLAQLFAQSQQGFAPEVQNQIGNLPGLQNQILQGGYFGNEQAQAYKDLISGKTLQGQGGTMYDMIQEQFAPQRNEARNYAASMGLSPTSGEAMGLMGNQLGAQDKSFTEEMMKQYMNMVNTGTYGLSSMDVNQLNRQKATGDLGSWLANFVEGNQQNRMNIGANITGMQQSPFMDLLNLGQQQNIAQMNQPKKPSFFESLFSAAGTVAPFFL